MSPNSSAGPKSFKSDEIMKKVEAITERCVKYISNNEQQNLANELDALPDNIGIDDLKNSDGLTLLHMATFKNQQKAFN